MTPREEEGLAGKVEGVLLVPLLLILAWMSVDPDSPQQRTKHS